MPPDEPIPLGVYDHPSPPEAAPMLRSVETAGHFGTTLLLYRTTQLLNAIDTRATDALKALMGGG